MSGADLLSAAIADDGGLPISPTSSELVALCQSGDRDAQRQLYELHHRRVFRLAVRMVGIQDAADMTQQVFLQVFRKIDQFSGRSQLETWLYRVAANECLQHLRRNGRKRCEVLNFEPTDQAPSHTGQTEQAELLNRALEQLEPELRSIFLLREVEGLPYREIAEAVAIPEGTVGSRLNRARRLLREFLVELGWERDDELHDGRRTDVGLSRPGSFC